MTTFNISGSTIEELTGACRDWLTGLGWTVTMDKTPAAKPEIRAQEGGKTQTGNRAPLPEQSAAKPEIRAQEAIKPAPEAAKTTSSPDPGTISKTDLIKIITRVTKARGAAEAQELMKDKSGRVRNINAIDPSEYPAIFAAAEARL